MANEMVPNWQFNVLPGNANQGAMLVTRKDIQDPPFDQDAFIWLAMEDIIGTADIKLEYNEKTNIYTLYKAKGHRDNNGNWSYEWGRVGHWERLSPEVAEILRQLTYVEYRYDTSESNTLKVIGIKKDMTEVEICNINFVSAQVLQEAVNTLNNTITAETTRASNKEDEIAEDLSDEVARATQRENELQDMIEAATMNPGRAIEVTSEKAINVLIDNDSIKTNNSNQLKANVIDDTAVRNDKGWSSAKISQELTSALHYKGQVATYADLPTIGLSVGDMYNVLASGDNYVWDGSLWDKLSGEYIAGAGIDITGKVISATGISFGTGDGLEVTGSGESAVLRVKGGNGIQFAADKTMNLKSGTGITVNSNGINVNPGQSLEIDGNNVEVKPESTSPLVVNPNGLNVQAEDGIYIDSNKLKIDTNFNIKSTPLGSDNSKLSLYSDGKIAVDTDSVVLTGELLLELVATTDSQHIFNNIVVPNMNNYDMFRFEYGITNISTGEYSLAAGEYFSKSPTIVNQTVRVFGAQGGNSTSGYVGIQFGIASFEGVDYQNGIISKYSRWTYASNTYPGASGSWAVPSSSSNRRETIRIYGMKAR